MTSREGVRALFQRVAESCDLPPLPAAAARALALARDPETRADELARVVSSDAVLATRVLMIARSVTYLRRNPPRTLPDAIATVGFRALRRILIAASARSAYRADDGVAHRLWQHALATALAADELAGVAREPRGGDAFIAGLLHDIGLLVFHLSDPAAYARLRVYDLAAEEALFGVNHAAVGGCLAEVWGLEDEVVEGILFHHHPDEVSRLGARIATADRIAHLLGYGSRDEAAAAAGVASADLDEVAERVQKSFESERELFA